MARAVTLSTSPDVAGSAVCRPVSRCGGMGQVSERATRAMRAPVADQVGEVDAPPPVQAPVLPSTPSRSRSTCPQCWAYSVIIRSTSQRRSTSSYQSSGRAVSSRS